MKSITRNRHLTAREAAKYDAIRRRIEEELPSLIARHKDRMQLRDELKATLDQLSKARKQKGMSLAALRKLTGMDQSALSKLETGQRPNPTVDTLERYAQAVGKHLQLQLVDREEG